MHISYSTEIDCLFEVTCTLWRRRVSPLAFLPPELLALTLANLACKDVLCVRAVRSSLKAATKHLLTDELDMQTTLRPLEGARRMANHFRVPFRLPYHSNPYPKAPLSLLL